MRRIYLDHNASTPLAPEVHEAMVKSLDLYGNPSSLHAAGQRARRAVDQARAQVAALLGAQPEEIVFTGSGTEANNLALRGAAKGGLRRIVVSSVEHSSVSSTCAAIAAEGGNVAYLPVNTHGQVSLDALDAPLRGSPALVSVMFANNEVGTLQPVSEIALRARARDHLIHTDAVQAAGKVPLAVAALGVDLLSVSAHKLYGPKGVGALYIRRGVTLDAQTHGGRQERQLRPGTENVAAIVGFGVAAALAKDRVDRDAALHETLRTHFETLLAVSVPDIHINGSGAPRLANTSSVRFDGIDGEALVVRLDLAGVEASTGAACGSALREPSRILLAMGQSNTAARSVVRFSWGRDHDGETIDSAVAIIAKTVAAMREHR